MEDYIISEEKKIGEQIRKIRQSKHMSQLELSEATKISLPYISEIENGKKTLGITNFIKIIEALQVSADTILRADVPQVRALCNDEITAVLLDCTPSESDAILKIIREVKTQFNMIRNEYEE